MSTKIPLSEYSPEIASQWHPTKNKGLSPDQVTIGSNKRVWWLGKCGHEWIARIASRANGSGCPYCSKKNRRTLPGTNDLTTLRPDLAAQWHPTKNSPLTPEMVTSKSNKKVWWLCEKGHEWEAIIANRVNGKGCPYCAGKKVLQGFNDLASQHPDLAAQWHPTKNGELIPNQVTVSSHKKIWWICPDCEHEWEAVIDSRTRNGSGCPYCSGRKVLTGLNDLTTVNPQLAADWHPSKNGELTPQQVTSKSGKKVWWQCSNNHEWEAVIANRANGTGCPICNRPGSPRKAP